MFHGYLIGSAKATELPNWQIEPNNTIANPITSQMVHVKINKPAESAVMYRLCTQNDDGSCKTGLVSFQGTDVYVELGFSSEKSSRLVGLYAYKGKDVNKAEDLLADKYPGITVNFDYRFRAVAYDLTAEKLPKGDFLLKATPTSTTDLDIAKQAKLYKWRFYTPVTSNDGTISWKSLSVSTTDKPELLVARSAPGIMYVGIKAVSTSNYDSTGYYEGLETVLSTTTDPAAHINKIVIQAKPETAVAPTITVGFSTNIVTSDNKIPANHKFALTKSQITLFSGGVLALPINPVSSQTENINPNYIEIELPNGISLNQPSVTSFKNKFTEVPTTISGYHRYRLEKDTGTTNWGQNNTYVNIYPTFADSMAGVANLQIKMRLYNLGEEGRTDLWQTLPITLEVPPDLRLPKRLTTSFSYANIDGGLLLNQGTNGNVDQFLNLYKKLGFNTVPARLTTVNLDTTKLLFTPKQRTTGTWEGLRYGPTFSAFYYNYVFSPSQYKRSIFNALFFDKIAPFFKITKTFDGKDALVAPTSAEFLASYDTLVTKDSFNAAFGTPFLTEDEFATEKTKFFNAIKYNIDTKGMDMAYDGILLTANLDDIEKITTTSKPEYFYLDAEDFTTYNDWKLNIPQSANAQLRKNPNESDLAEADRILSEFWDKFNYAVRKGSPDTKVVYYSSNAYNNKGMQVTPWKILQDHNFIQQTDTYIPGRNLGEFINLIRANKLALPEHYDSMPILTTGTYNEIDPQMIFDQVIHTFLNGATGFSYFGESTIDDMADVLNISKAIKLVSPFEDLIMDGDVAYSDISDINNATVSAMKKDRNYLIGVTPEDKTKNSKLTIHTGNNLYYLMVDQKTNESTLFRGPDINIDKALDTTTVYSLIPTSGSLLLTTDKHYAMSGSEITYTLAFKNTTGGTINSVIFESPIPDFATLVTSSVTNSGIIENNKIKWNVSNLTANQEFSAQYKLKVR